MALNIESCSREEVCASFGENEKLLDELRDRLQDWLRLQPHLPQDVPKALLESLIIGTKMSLEQAKKKLDMYYTLKQPIPELFADRDPRGPSLTKLHSMIDMTCLPKLSPEKCRVYIFRPYVKDYSELDAYACYRYMLMMEDILLHSSNPHCMGTAAIFDHSSISLNFVAKFTPVNTKKFLVAVTEAYARRIRGIHFVNPTSLTELLVTFSKKMLKPKLAARIHVHPKGSYESLHRHFSKSVLPKDYGGEEPSISHLAELWRQKTDENRDWFLEQEKIVADERRRPGQGFNADDFFGFAGSFRKLNVD